MGVTYDTGALMAADRGERRISARHRSLLALREVPTVPAPVVAQSWRGGGREALLARLLAGCDVEALDDGQACSVGRLARAPRLPTSWTRAWSKEPSADTTSWSVPTTTFRQSLPL